MLGNELTCLENLHSERTVEGGRKQTVCSFLIKIEDCCSAIQSKWLTVSFEDHHDHTLSRYYSFHFFHLTKLLYSTQERGYASDNEMSQIFDAKYNELLVHLLKNYNEYLSCLLPLTPSLKKNFLQSLKPDVDALVEGVKNGQIDNDLVEVINGYFRQQLSSENEITLHRVRYLKLFVTQLQLTGFGTSATTGRLIEKLIELNFNHLGFLNYLEQRNDNCGEDTHQIFAYLLQEKRTVAGIPMRKDLAFDPEFPDIKTLYLAWVNEYVNYIKMKDMPGSVQAVAPKLALNTSVAHLAGFLRVFQREGFFADQSISVILKFACANFTTKKQKEISYGSLSKEYYSVTQSTAARVKNILDHLGQRILKEYFPR